MTDTEETELDTVRRHVQEAEDHVARQREIVDRLPPTGDLADIARALLADYEAALALHRAHLERLQDA